LKEHIIFTVFDKNQLLKDVLIGQYIMTLGELLSYRKNGDIELILEPLQKPDGGLKSTISVGKKKNLENFGILVISYSLKQLFSQAEFAQPLPISRRNDINLAIAEQQAQFAKMKNIITQLRNHEKGVLAVQIMNLEGVPSNETYDLTIEVLSPYTNITGTGTEMKSAKEFILNKKPPLQQPKPQFITVGGPFLSSHLKLTLSRAGAMRTNKVIGTAELSFQHMIELLQPGNPSLFIHFDRFSSTNPTYQPQIIASINYYNSLFTQMPEGKLEFKVNFWLFNGNAFPQNYYLTIKVGKGKEMSYKMRYKTQEFIVSPENMLETMVISVNEDKMFQKDPEITRTEVRVFELFSDGASSSGNIIHQAMIHSIDFHDFYKQCDVSLALASRFTPKSLADAQIRALEGLHHEWLAQRQQQSEKNTLMT
jgi:hypothetical protein